MVSLMKLAWGLCAVIPLAAQADAGKAQLPVKEKQAVQTDWPNDVDGDVFRRMKKSGFDFNKMADIDFNVDFSAWPPSPAFLAKLRTQYARVKLFPPDEHGSGYVQVVVHARVNYQLVVSVQHAVSEMARPYGGVCESWGVWQE